MKLSMLYSIAGHVFLLLEILAGLYLFYFAKYKMTLLTAPIGIMIIIVSLFCLTAALYCYNKSDIEELKERIKKCESAQIV